MPSDLPLNPHPVLASWYDDREAQLVERAINRIRVHQFMAPDLIGPSRRGPWPRDWWGEFWEVLEGTTEERDWVLWTAFHCSLTREGQQPLAAFAEHDVVRDGRPPTRPLTAEADRCACRQCERRPLELPRIECPACGLYRDPVVHKTCPGCTCTRCGETGVTGAHTCPITAYGAGPADSADATEGVAR